MLGPWMNAVLREDVTDAVAPTGFTCRTSRPDAGLIHATTVVEGGKVPICSQPAWRRGASFKQDFKRDSITAGSVEEAANQLGGRFCIDCEILLKASLKIQVDRFFG